MAQESGTGWRIVLFTNIPGGITLRFLAEAARPLGHRVVGVVTTPGPKSRRSDDYLDVVQHVPAGLDVIIANHPNRIARMIEPLRADLVVVAGFPWLIPEEVIALPPLGAINLHPSLLPEHRGPYPIEWALRTGQQQTGFTVHRLGGAFDNGPVLAQRTVPIFPDDDGDTLLHRLVAVAPDLLRTALTSVAAGAPGDPQDESRATYAGAFEDAWRAIDWTRPARHIHNQVRSWTGFRSMPHGAIGELDGIPHAITRTRLLSGAGDEGARPGATIATTDGRLVVQCGDGALEIVAAAPLDDGGDAASA